MPDKKLTDSEIKRALEICGTYKGKCTDCPAFVKVDRSNCKEVLLGAVEIINRLQAENEQWKEEANRYQNLWCEAVKDIQTAKADAYKECIEKVQKKLDPTLIAITRIGCVLVDVSKSHISEKDALQKIRDYLNGLEIETRLSFDMAVCDLLKELAGDTK